MHSQEGVNTRLNRDACRLRKDKPVNRTHQVILKSLSSFHGGCSPRLPCNEMAAKESTPSGEFTRAGGSGVSSKAIRHSLSVAERVHAEQIDWLRAPSQSARSKLQPVPPIHRRLPGRREEGAGDD